jgi:hypothetical protein
VSCNDSAGKFYVLDMYQTYLDATPLGKILPSSTDLYVHQAYTVWTAAARQVWLNIFGPNDRTKSILRQSLLANNLDSLNIVYNGIAFLYLAKG